MSTVILQFLEQAVRLAAAAHLKRLKGLEVRYLASQWILGRAMPEGMFSAAVGGSHIQILSRL